MSGPDSILIQDDLEASKTLLKSAEGSNENSGCLKFDKIDAKPPDDIKHLIAKDETTLTK